MNSDEIPLFPKCNTCYATFSRPSSVALYTYRVLLHTSFPVGFPHRPLPLPSPHTLPPCSPSIPLTSPPLLPPPSLSSLLPPPPHSHSIPLLSPPLLRPLSSSSPIPSLSLSLHTYPITPSSTPSPLSPPLPSSPIPSPGSTPIPLLWPFPSLRPRRTWPALSEVTQ